MYKLYYRYQLALIVSDFFVTLLILLAVANLRPLLPGQEIAASLVIPHHSIYLVTPLSLLIVFGFSGVYNFRQRPRPSVQMRSFVLSYALWGWFFVGILYFSFRDVSRLFVIYFSVSNFVALAVCRYILWSIMPGTQNGNRAGKVLIFGDLKASSGLSPAILRELTTGYAIVGFSDFEAPKDIKLQAPFLGTAEHLPKIVRENQIDIVIMSLDTSSLSALRPLVMELIKIPVRLFLAQNYSQLPFIELDIERIGNVVMVGILEPIINGWNRMFKRIFDLVIATLSLILTWPVFIMIALAIKIESSGPVIFPAKRVGNGGKLFTMYKFRTMIDKAQDPDSSGVKIDGQGRKIYKFKNDPRITKVGKFLRRWSLDELPQLFNVIKGEMSMVGPRPEQPFITQEYEAWQWQRILVPPGITGWWQISGRNEAPMHLNTHLDLYYVTNYSMFMDLKILFLTVFEVFRGRGAD
jgi:exopolysaccharide biosynthesis polyprenyl glycosylphosphotransferase